MVHNDFSDSDTCLETLNPEDLSGSSIDPTTIEPQSSQFIVQPQPPPDARPRSDTTSADALEELRPPDQQIGPGDDHNDYEFDESLVNQLFLTLATPWSILNPETHQRMHDKRPFPDAGNHNLFGYFLEIVAGSALGLEAGAAELGATAGEKTISVFHGSIKNGPEILERGLDAARTPSFVSRDLAAAQDALLNHPNAVPGLGQIIESRIPVTQFNQVLAPFERPYGGFYPYGLESTEITLRTPEQVQLFNQFIVR
jgi:hypothetical protein